MNGVRALKRVTREPPSSAVLSIVQGYNEKLSVYNLEEGSY